MASRYRDRTDAGEQLGEALGAYANRNDVVVLGLVRGGVPVAAAVAARLRAPLDVLVVRKLGVPWAPEVAFGALGPGGVQIRNPHIADRLERSDVDAVAARETDELLRRERQYRAGRPAVDLTGKIAIIVDDGLATGATARAAVAVTRRLGAARVTLAVPVGAPEAVSLLAAEADEVICLMRPPDFDAVGRFYEDFGQVDDDTVVELLRT
jgi:predicted phosphoribosyltransferase